MENYLKTLDPAWKNNSREIVRGKLEHLKRFPSSQMREEVDKITGRPADIDDKDMDFFEPKKYD